MSGQGAVVLMLATVSLLPTEGAGGWPPSMLAALLQPLPSAAATVALGTSMHVCWHKGGARRGGCAVVEEGMVPYNGTHTFPNFPMSGVNFPHFSKCGKCELTHKEVWKSVANSATVPTSSKVCVEKLNRNLSKKSETSSQLFHATPTRALFYGRRHLRYVNRLR